MSVSPDQRTNFDQAEIGEAVTSAVAVHRDEPGPLIEILHSVQSRLGWIPPEAVGLLAHELNLSRAEVHGVVTFYHDFREQPPARRTVRICRAEACQSRGANDLVAYAVERVGVPLGQTTADGGTGLEQVFCFGNCALGPAVEVDGVLHGRVDRARLAEILSDDTQSGDRDEAHA